MTMRSTEATMARDSDVGAWRRGNIALALAGLVAVAGAPGSAWAQERGADWGWGMHPMSWMWGAWRLGMILMMLVFWGLVIAGSPDKASDPDRIGPSTFSASGTREARSTRTNSRRSGAIFAE
jgi:hypothetical protein